MAFNDVSDKIKRAIETFSMLERGDTVLVGFSGGKDSVVLLHALNLLSAEYEIGLSALHVNHNIRGQEADRDELFCRTFCEKNGIDFVCVSVNAVEYAEKNRLGLEEAARILRYSAFSDVARQKNITKIATAHTASDNLETVLFNLARGTSSDGLKGIPPIRDNIIRPLIYCTSDDILDYAKERSLEFVTDSSNADTDYSRNHIRHNIIPQIKKLNPHAENAVSNMCDTVRQDLDYLSECTENIKTSDTFRLSGLHDAVLSRVLITLYKKTADSTQLSYVHVTNMTRLLKKYVSDSCTEIKRLSLPGKIDFVITPTNIYFEEKTENKVLGSHILSYGLNEFEETGDAVFLSDNQNDINNIISKNVYKISIHNIVKKSITADTIIVRGRQPSDTFSFSNMTKKVKKMLNEAKIPLSKRDRLPIFCDSKGIFLIAGFPLRDDVKPIADEESVHIYYLTTGDLI